MKLANLGGCAVIVTDGGVIDIHDQSDGRFGPDIHRILDQWDEFRAWAGKVSAIEAVPVPDERTVDAVVPRPGQVFAVGLNYRAHAVESGLPIPAVPLVFTKFPSSIAAPTGVLELPTGQVDWEVEVAVVVARRARRIAAAEAWDHLAGVTAAQDYSARDVQMAGGAMPQFSLGKSFPGFTPLGPLLVTADEFTDPDAIELRCEINGETVQASNTSDLIFSVPEIVSYLSHIVTLEPGDVILTGTPSGVGLGMTPPRYLAPGDHVVTSVAKVGRLRQDCVAAPDPFDPALILA